MKPSGKLLSKIIHRMYYELVRGPLGHGKPITREAWESMYRDCAWNHLQDLTEVAHYAVVVGYIRSCSQNGVVWDIGCGAGRLLQLLQPHFSRYVGVDLSEEALKSASALNISRTEFYRTSFEAWSPNEKADIIVFNESIYYANRPADVLNRYAALLKPHGRIIVSALNYRHRHAMWRRIEKTLLLVTAATIENTNHQKWRIGLFAPISASDHHH